MRPSRGLYTLLKEGLIDTRQLSDLMSAYIIWRWERYEPVFDSLKCVLRDWLEYLYREVMKVVPLPPLNLKTSHHLGFYKNRRHTEALIHSRIKS
jgi:hypothetical protein